MADVTINTGHAENDPGMIVSVHSPRPPFEVGVGIHAQEYIVGTDFTSGDDLIFNVRACDTIKFAVFVTNVGAVKAFAETALAGGGRILTLSNCTTNIKAFIVNDV